MIRLALAFALLLTPSFTLADAPTLQPMPKPAPASPPVEEKIAVQAWGKKNPACKEWSDGCVACTPAGCSTPGIACTPRDTVCRKP